VLRRDGSRWRRCRANRGLHIRVIAVRETDAFADWMAGLQDGRAWARIVRRIDRLTAGNPAA
jgi:hypothetical protein